MLEIRRNLWIQVVCGAALVAAGAQGRGAAEQPVEDGRCRLNDFPVEGFLQALHVNTVSPTPETLDEYQKYFASGFRMWDPITATEGWPAYREVLEQFTTAEKIQFKVLGWACTGRTLYVTWLFGMKSDPASKAVAATREYTEVEGISRFVVGADNRIAEDIEYWATVPPSWRGKLR